MNRPRRPSVRGVSLFWRTFMLLTGLLLASIIGWTQTFRTLEFEPRALQSAQQLASLVNLSRAALTHADAIARVSLIKTLADEENLRIAPRVDSDTFTLYDNDDLGRRISQLLKSQLGQGTVVAREVNGFTGLWLGFQLDNDNYWLLVDPERIGTLDTKTWLVWLSIGLAVSLLGAAGVARLINHPLKKLSFAASKVREGNFEASHLSEDVATSEIREVNMGFNRMAEQLGQADQDRALMLAGISHDLRTPLARLRLEAEMSVPDEQARGHMAADIDQVTAIIDKFLDYARADSVTLVPVDLSACVQAAAQGLGPKRPLKLRLDVPDKMRVMADEVELKRVISNLLENALRYGKSPNGMAEVDIAAKLSAPWVLIRVRDHGPGVDEAVLPRLTQPFFRGDAARTAANGSGLGLAIVSRTVGRLGGRFELANSKSGGLSAHIKLLKA